MLRVNLGVGGGDHPDCADGKVPTETDGPNNLRSSRYLEDTSYGGGNDVVNRIIGDATDGILY